MYLHSVANVYAVLPFYNVKCLCSGSLKCWHFVSSEDIITKFKSQGLYTIKIKY